MYFKTPETKIILLFAALIVIVVSITCKKIDNTGDERLHSQSAIRTKFFTIKPTTDPLVTAIAASIDRQDNQLNFITKLTQQAGFPIWDKAKIVSSKEKTGQMVYIPFVLENIKQTNALLLVKLIGADTLYHLLYGTHYRKYGFDSIAAKKGWNAKDIFHAFILFDNEIFGATKFIVTDSRLLNPEGNNSGNNPQKAELSKITTQLSRTNTIWYQTTSFTIIVCGTCYPFKTTIDGPCCNATYYDCVITWYWDDAGGSSWDWYAPPTSTYTGGQPCANCDWASTNPCVQEEGHPPIICNTEWRPEEINEFNPDAVDSIRIDQDSHLKDSFPCLARLITDTLLNSNAIAQRALYDIFDVAAYNHLTFSINWNADSTSNYEARTTPGRREWMNDQMHFFDTIQFNPYYLKHASKEKYIALILHESIHAYINWCITSYNNQANGVDSNYLKQHFPIHWEYLTGKQFVHDSQHDLMVNNYSDIIIDAIIAHGNQGASLSLRTFVAQSITYSGMRETSFWKTLSDTCKMKAADVWSSRFDYPSNYTITPLGCGTYTHNFRDSLQLSGHCQ